MCAVVTVDIRRTGAVAWLVRVPGVARGVRLFIVVVVAVQHSVRGRADLRRHRWKIVRIATCLMELPPPEHEHSYCMYLHVFTCHKFLIHIINDHIQNLFLVD